MPRVSTRYLLDALEAVPTGILYCNGPDGLLWKVPPHLWRWLGGSPTSGLQKLGDCPRCGGPLWRAQPNPHWRWGRSSGYVSVLRPLLQRLRRERRYWQDGRQTTRAER